MTVTVPELVPESIFFPAGKFSRSNRTRSRRKECFISKSVRCCTHIVQKLYIDICISRGETGEIERIECWLFFSCSTKWAATPHLQRIFPFLEGGYCYARSL